MVVITSSELVPSTSWSSFPPLLMISCFILLVVVSAMCSLCKGTGDKSSSDGDGDYISYHGDKSPLLPRHQEQQDFHFTLSKHDDKSKEKDDDSKNVQKLINVKHKKGLPNVPQTNQKARDKPRNGEKTQVRAQNEQTIENAEDEKPIAPMRKFSRAHPYRPPRKISIGGKKIVELGNPLGGSNFSVKVTQPGGILKKPSLGSLYSSTSTLIAPPDAVPPSDACADENENIGSLYFNVSYSVEHLALKLTVMKAVNLPSKDISGEADPYVKILLRPDKKHKLETTVKFKNRNPVWNEVFTFEGFQWRRLVDRTLYLQVLDYDRFSRNDPIGECELPLSDCKVTEAPIMFVKQLSPCKHSCSHDLHGDLLISMCYEPSPNQTYCKITIVVMKALNLKCVDISGVCDPYVKIYLYDGENKTQKKKTTIQKRTLTPVWNERFVFEVSPKSLRELSFVLSVVDWDRVLPNEAIGQMIVGYHTSGTSLKHWKDTMDHPRKTIAMWHKIIS